MSTDSDRDMTLTFVDRKEKKFISPDKECVSPQGNIINCLTTVENSSDNQSSRADCSQEENVSMDTFSQSEETGVSVNNMNQSKESSVTMETNVQSKEPDVLLETNVESKENGISMETVYHSNNTYDESFIDRTERKLLEELELVDYSKNMMHVKFSEPTENEQNQTISKSKEPVISSDLIADLRGEDTEETNQSEYKGYEIMSSTSIMLFQERNLFEDDKDSTDSSNNIPLKYDLEADKTMTWKKDSLADRYWKQDKVSSVDDNLPEIEVWPAVSLSEIGQNTPMLEKETVEREPKNQSFPVTVTEELRLQKESVVEAVSHSAVENQAKAKDKTDEVKQQPVQESATFVKAEESDMITGEGKEHLVEVVEKSISASETETLCAEIQVEDSIEPIIPIEVERKFIVTPECLENLSKLGASLLKEKTFTDSYYDDSSYSLTLSGCWLRQRNQSWEMKIAEQESTKLSTIYKELSKEEDILAYLLSFFKLDDEKCKNMTIVELLNQLNLSAFATYTTNRKTYSLPDCSVDLDMTDFGFQVGEIEVMVADKSRIPAALNTIEKTAQLLGFRCLSLL